VDLPRTSVVPMSTRRISSRATRYDTRIDLQRSAQTHEKRTWRDSITIYALEETFLADHLPIRLRASDLNCSLPLQRHTRVSPRSWLTKITRSNIRLFLARSFSTELLERNSIDCSLPYFHNSITRRRDDETLRRCAHGQVGDDVVVSDGRPLW